MVWRLGDQIHFHQLTRKTRRVLTPEKKVKAKITHTLCNRDLNNKVSNPSVELPNLNVLSFCALFRDYFCPCFFPKYARN